MPCYKLAANPSQKQAPRLAWVGSSSGPNCSACVFQAFLAECDTVEQNICRETERLQSTNLALAD